VAGVLVALAIFGRRRTPMGIWFLWAAPYLAYETVVGGTPDVGAHLVYVLPFAAVVAAVGLDALLSRGEGWVAARRGGGRVGAAVVPVLRILASGILLVPGLRLVLVADPPTWWEARQDAGVDLARWVATHTPRDALLVGESDPVAAMSLACQSGREVVQTRPLCVRDLGEKQEEGFWILSSLEPGSGLICAFLEPLTSVRMDALLRSGRWVFSLTADPFGTQAGSGADLVSGAAYRLHPCAVAVEGAARPLYRLVPPGVRGAVRCELEPREP